MRAIACLSVLMFAACAPPEPGPIPGLLGKTRLEVVAEFGAPERSWPVPLDSPLSIHKPVIRALPSDLVGVVGVEIEEMRWKHGDFLVAVFVARRPGKPWRVIDSFRWHNQITVG